MGLETRSDGETHRRTPRDWAGAALGRFPAVPLLVLGPLLRYVSETEATVWVETDVPCEVVVLDHSARTFQVEGHYYALLRIRGLTPATATEYAVALDGERVWPPEEHDFPPSLIRTIDPDSPVR